MRSASITSAGLRICAAVGFFLSGVAPAFVSTAMSDGGDRTLHLFHTHTRETGDFTFKHNGRYDRGVLVQMNHFLRDWRNDKQTVMDPQLFDTLWAIQQQVGGGRINIVSCYRSPETNHMLHTRSRGVAEHSQHMLGKAMDIFIVGVPLEKLRETAMKMQVGGVGYYPTSGSPFVHVDTGNVRMWPRMTRSQLASVFPNGNTLYVPADGTPLPGYDVAQQKFGSKNKETQMAMLDAKMGGGGPRLTQAALRGSASVPSTTGEKPNVASWLKKVFKDEDDSEDQQDSGQGNAADDGPAPAVAGVPAAPVIAPRPAPGPTDLIASPSASGGTLAMAPLPRMRPALEAPAAVGLAGTIDGTQGAATLAFAPLPKGKPGMANNIAVAALAPAPAVPATGGTAVDAIADLTARMDVNTPVVASPVVLASSGRASDAVSALVDGSRSAGGAVAAASQLGHRNAPGASESPVSAQLAYADATPTSDYDTTYGGRYANTPRAAPRSARLPAIAAAAAPAAPAVFAAKPQQVAFLQTPVAPVSRIVTPIGHASLRVDQALADSVQQDDESMRRLMSQLTTRTKAFAKMGKPDPARGAVLFTTPATVADARNTTGGAALRTDRFAPAPVAPAATTASVEPTLLQRLFSSF